MVRKIKKNKKGKTRSDATLKKIRLEFQMVSAEILESELILEDCIVGFNDRFETGRDKKIVEESEALEESKHNRSFDQEEERKAEERESNKTDFEEIIPEDRDLRDLFKKIALKTHPDKLLDEEEDEVEYLTELYKDAARAAEVGDGMALLEIAYELGISVKIDPAKEVEWLNKKIKTLKENVAEMKSTAEWVWGHSDGNERERVESLIKDQLGFKFKDAI
tara:strand:+ start:2912 stop:3574 length:663 start_codon:yes stop_codon:yes gene_type:complete